MGEIEEVKDGRTVRESSPVSHPSDLSPQPTVAVEEKETFVQRVLKPGSVWQIIIAALLAIAIGLIVTTQVDEVPEAAIALTAIFGTLWLRALRAVGTSVIPCLYNSKLTVSAPNDRHCDDYGDSTPSQHDSRRW